MRHRRTWALPSLVAALLLSACAAVDTPDACRATKVADIPLRMAGNTPLVDATIDGQPVRLMLDTGAQSTVIDEDVFRRLNLQYDYRLPSLVGGLGGQTARWLTRRATLGLGSLALEPAPLGVGLMKWPLQGENRIDGLLGAGTLAAYDVEVDMAHGRLGLFRPRRCPGGPSPFGDLSPTIHATLDPAQRLLIPIAVNGHSLAAAVDTGATLTFIDPRRVGLTPSELAKDRPIRVLTPDPAGIAARLHRFDQVDVNGQSYYGPTLAVGLIPSPGIDALLGADFLRPRRLWLSWAGAAVTIAPPLPALAAAGLPPPLAPP